MSWPAPHHDDARVIDAPGGDGWNYDPDGRLPSGDWHWTAHLTNALHDAGWQVNRERAAALRARINREATRR